MPIELPEFGFPPLVSASCKSQSWFCREIIWSTKRREKKKESNEPFPSAYICIRTTPAPSVDLPFLKCGSKIHLLRVAFERLSSASCIWSLSSAVVLSSSFCSSAGNQFRNETSSFSFCGSNQKNSAQVEANSNISQYCKISTSC